MEDEKFHFEVSERNDSPLLILSGNFCSANVRPIQGHLDRYFAHNEEIIVYVDLTKVGYMDSAGLGTLVYFHTYFRKKKRKLILINDSPKTSYLSRMFEATCLHEVFEIIKTKEAN